MLPNPRLPSIAAKEPFRRFFTPKEDELIIKLFTEFPERWNYISAFIEGRTPKQIRDRYTNYLAPNLVDSPWTPEEDRLLMELADKFNNRWASIVPYFTGRSANSLKNRYHRHLKRKANLVQNEQHPAKLPPISVAMEGLMPFPVYNFRDQPPVPLIS